MSGAAPLMYGCVVLYAGNVTFTPDGNSLISPVGNRVTVFNLASSTSVTLPFEHVKGASRLRIGSLGMRCLISDS